MKMKMNTPWGEAQTIEALLGGKILVVSTAGHGGIRVDPSLKHRMTRWPSPFLGNEWFEEDCDAAHVVASFPEVFSEEAAERARAHVIAWELRMKERSAACVKVA